MSKLRKTNAKTGFPHFCILQLLLWQIWDLPVPSWIPFWWLSPSALQDYSYYLMTVLWYFSFFVDLKHLSAAGIWCRLGCKKCLHLHSPRWGGCSQCSGWEGSSTTSCKPEGRQERSTSSSSSIPKAPLLLGVLLPVRKGSSGSQSAALLCMVCFGQEEPSAED